jgi:hypothetical protein
MSGETVAQLTKTLPAAFFRRLAPFSAKILSIKEGLRNNLQSRKSKGKVGEETCENRIDKVLQLSTLTQDSIL